jgi:hypothetical protein
MLQTLKEGHSQEDLRIYQCDFGYLLNLLVRA